MNRVSRMMLIIGVMVLIGLSALYFVAKRLRSAVQETPRVVEQVAPDNPIPIPVIEGETAAEVAGIPEQSESEQEPVAEAPQVDPLQEKIAVFADARHAVWEVLEKYPKTRDSWYKELTDTVDTDRVRMYNYEMVEIRIARSRPLREAGMEEEEYKAIRAQYRSWRGGEGELDPVFKAAFEAAPEEVMTRADLQKYELIDY